MRSATFKRRRHDATAEILVDAAGSAIARKDYESVTMRDIAAEAGCALGTLYLYFKSKRELVDALLERHGKVLHGQLMEAVAAARTPLEKLRLLSQALLEYFNQHRDVFKVYYSATEMKPGPLRLSLPRRMRKMEEELRQMEIEIIREAQALGEIRRDFSPERIQSFRQGLTVGLLGELSLREELPDKDEQMRMLWGFQTDGIGARGNHAATR